MKYKCLSCNKKLSGKYKRCIKHSNKINAINRIKRIYNSRFGRLIVLNRYNRKNRMTKVLCKCDCGKQKWINKNSLKRGLTKSCGCLQKELLKCRKLKNHLASKNQLFNIYKRNSRKRNLIFKLNFDYFIKLLESLCYYCKAKSSNKYIDRTTKEIYKYNGIDRVNNKKGYTIKNSVPCCKICNKAKDVLTKDEFIKWIKRIYINIKREKLI